MPSPVDIFSAEETPCTKQHPLFSWSRLRCALSKRRHRLAAAKEAPKPEETRETPARRNAFLSWLESFASLFTPISWR